MNHRSWGIAKVVVVAIAFVGGLYVGGSWTAIGLALLVAIVVS